MLIQNYSASIINNCGHYHSGQTAPMWVLWPETMRGYYVRADVNSLETQTEKDSFPTGTNPPYCYILGDKGALLSSTTTIAGDGEMTVAMAMGRALASDLTGTGTLSTANLSMIVQMAAALLGSCTVSASLKGSIQMASSLAGSGNFTASIKIIAGVVASITGSGSVTANLKGKASLAADITPFTDLSPENLAASVWNSLAASYNSVGTMGEKVNDAGSAANPWTEVIESGYTAAEILRILAAVAAGKSSGQPTTVVFRDLGDTKNRVSGTVDSSGNRTGVTIDET